MCVFTCEYSVDRGVSGQAGLPTLMEDPSVGQVLREEETPGGEHKEKTSNQTWTENMRDSGLKFSVVSVSVVGCAEFKAHPWRWRTGTVFLHLLSSINYC